MQWNRRPWIGLEDNVAFHEEDVPWVGTQGQAMIQKMQAQNRLPMRSSTYQELWLFPSPAVSNRTNYQRNRANPRRVDSR